MGIQISNEGEKYGSDSSGCSNGECHDLVTPLIFVFSLAAMLKSIHEGKPHLVATIVCAVSFWMIVAPIMFGIVWLAGAGLFRYW